MLTVTVLSAVYAEEQRLDPEFAEYSMSPEVRKVYEQMEAAIKTAINQLEVATQLKAFSDPSASASLAQLSGALGRFDLHTRADFPFPAARPARSRITSSWATATRSTCATCWPRSTSR